MARLTLRLLLALLMLMPAAANAEWRRYETPHFFIYSESDEKEVTKLAEGLESIDGLMRMVTGLGNRAEPVKVRIYQVASEGEVQKALGLSNSGVAGFYDSNVLGPFAVTPRKTYFGTGTFTPELVLHHEYAHHFMLQYFPAIYPAWYVEGFAELIGSSTIMADGRVAYGMAAKHRGDEISFDWVPLDELLLQPPEKIHDFDLYGQGWAMTHFFTFSKTRAQQMRRYLSALTAGQPPAEAAKVFGDLGELNREAHRYLDAGSFSYTPVAVPISRPVIQRVEAISPGEAALIPQVIAYRDDELTTYRRPDDRAREQKLRQENLEAVRRKSREFPNDPYTLYFLAQAEYGAGNYSAAEAAADRLLAIQPNHVRAMVTKSLCMARAAGALPDPDRGRKAEEARKLALRANRLDPDDAYPLLAYYQGYHLAGVQPVRQAVEALEMVVATLPYDTRARQLLVDEYAAEKKWAAAIAALLPIANDPHASPRRQAAREQMARLQSELAKARGGQPPTQQPSAAAKS